jgi:YidC/Oxa1 family membrane protein insertase
VNPLSPLEDALQWVVDGLHDSVGLTYGWSIVVLTIIVRAALLPLVIRQYRSMRQMQLLAPQLKEVQRKYKGDRKKQQEELMKLYQEHNANPFASCLPLVAQIPVFIALYYVLKDFADTASADTDLSFMWVIPDITVNVSDIGWTVLIIGLVYGASQLLSTELSFEPQTPDTQRRIMRFVPIVVVVSAFQFPFPAGLAIYWVTTNLWTAGQMLIIKHKIGLHIAEHPEEVAGAPKSSRDGRRAGADDVAAAPAAALVEGDASDGAADGETPEAPARETRPARTPAASRPSNGSGDRRKPRPKGSSGNRAGQRRPPKKRR